MQSKFSTAKIHGDLTAPFVEKHLVAAAETRPHRGDWSDGCVDTEGGREGTVMRLPLPAYGHLGLVALVSLVAFRGTLSRTM